MLKKQQIYILAGLVLAAILILVGTYIDKRINHSFGESYASPPPELGLRWIQINYDTHYTINAPLYYLHKPIGWIDHKITGVDIRLWANDFEGNKDNYSREAYN